VDSARAPRAGSKQQKSCQKTKDPASRGEGVEENAGRMPKSSGSAFEVWGEMGVRRKYRYQGAYILNFCDRDTKVALDLIKHRRCGPKLRYRR